MIFRFFLVNTFLFSFAQGLPYFYIALGLSTFIFMLELYLDLRQLVHLGGFLANVPDELARFVNLDEKNARAIVSWQISRLVFNRVELMLEFLAECLLLSGNYLPWLWDFSGDLLGAWLEAPLSDYALFRGCVYIFLVSLSTSVVRFPFGLYRLLFLDNKFEWGALGGQVHAFKVFLMFMSRQIKVFLLSLAFGAPAIAAILLLLRWQHDYYWVFLGVFLSLVGFLFTDAYQLFIPLFENFEPLENRVLRDEIKRLSLFLHFPLSDVLTIDHTGLRSVHSNAFLFGWRFRKSVVLYDTLVEKLSTDEVLAILAHEIGHHYYYHTYKTLLMQLISLSQFILTLAFLIDMPEFYASFGFAPGVLDPAVGIVLISYLNTSIANILQFGNNFVSRQFEFSADAYALRNGLDRLDDALIKIHAKSLTNVHPDPWFARYHYSHPSLVERLKAIEALREELASGTPQTSSSSSSLAKKKQL